MRPIRKIVIHNSATPRDLDKDKTIQSFNNTHKARLHPNENDLGYHIAYHFLVFGDGSVVQTRDIKDIGYHAGSWLNNYTSIGICMIGNYDEEKPTDESLQALQSLVTDLELEHDIKPTNVVGHRSLKATSCPGKYITDELLARISAGEFKVDDIDMAPPTWAEQAWTLATKNGIISSKNNPNDQLTLEKLEWILFNAGALSKVNGDMSLARFMTALNRISPIKDLPKKS